MPRLQTGMWRVDGTGMTQNQRVSPLEKEVTTAGRGVETMRRG
jgi:hypothetical protein